MNITIRIMNSEDIAAVAELERELFSDAWNERSLENTLFYRQETSFAAELDGQVTGYLFFMAAADEGELLRIGVSPACRRLGIGQALIEQMNDYARDNGIGSIWLEVRESNEAARRLYEKSGFVIQGYRKRYYHNPDEDAAIMCKMI
ncbi:MAG: ribosomal protein S18-alanine N-acetyltransferase [Lachnospiraceae bacterium]